MNGPVDFVLGHGEEVEDDLGVRVVVFAGGVDLLDLLVEVAL